MKKAVLLILLLFLFFMPLQNWEGLQKSITDAETIEQAIARLIAVHEEAATSHLGANESLAAHKAADVIDHPAYSVVRDKLIFDRNQIDFYFSSLDAFAEKTLGVILSGFNECALITTASLNNIQNISMYAGDYSGEITFSAKNPNWEINILLSHTTNFLAYIIQGYPEDYAGFGFKIEDGTIYAVYWSGDYTENTYSLGSISAQVYHKLRCELVDGVSLKFFIDDVEVYDFGAVSPRDDLVYLFVSLKTKTAAVRSLRVKDFHWDSLK